MKIKAMIAALMLGLSLSAAAQITTVQLSHEVRLSDIRLPQSSGGTIGYKTCDDCAYETTRVSSYTRYTFNGQRMTLDKFRVAVSRVGDRNGIYATVLQHLEEDVVTAVTVTLP